MDHSSKRVFHGINLDNNPILDKIYLAFCSNLSRYILSISDIKEMTGFEKKDIEEVLEGSDHFNETNTQKNGSRRYYIERAVQVEYMDRFLGRIIS